MCLLIFIANCIRSSGATWHWMNTICEPCLTRSSSNVRLTTCWRCTATAGGGGKGNISGRFASRKERLFNRSMDDTAFESTINFEIDFESVAAAEADIREMEVPAMAANVNAADVETSARGDAVPTADPPAVAISSGNGNEPSRDAAARGGNGSEPSTDAAARGGNGSGPARDSVPEGSGAGRDAAARGKDRP